MGLATVFGIGHVVGHHHWDSVSCQLATLQNQLHFRNHVWGNLATEEGVDELLQVGWKVEGLHSEVYDKPRRIGYDESMLMGEYQEQQPRVGVEITMMQE